MKRYIRVMESESSIGLFEAETILTDKKARTIAKYILSFVREDIHDTIINAVDDSVGGEGKNLITIKFF